MIASAPLLACAIIPCAATSGGGEVRQGVFGLEQSLQPAPSREVPRSEFYRCDHCSLRKRVAFAYGFDELRIAMLDGMAAARYSRQAPGTPPLAAAAIRKELEERFQLHSLVEPRPYQVYVLRRTPIGKELIAADVSNPENAPRGHSGGASGKLTGGWSMEELVRFLQVAMKTPVVDETELGVHYQLAVPWGQPDFTGAAVARREAELELRQEYRALDTLVILGAQRPE